MRQGRVGIELPWARRSANIYSTQHSLRSACQQGSALRNHHCGDPYFI